MDAMDGGVEVVLRAIRHRFHYYKTFVVSNPLVVSEMESALRWISYLITATKLNNNHIISELLYSCSSLLSLFNDTILRKSFNIKINAVSISSVVDTDMT
ncbi:unnamed protein product [Oppiella nova]|uniref:Peroxisomal membrane protein PEX16 n=1 Tax=Oppiella nova TaxID=334625 RepID=A0A7R9MUW3_9ACAR|nr:unnamed protein product [Oppiella nova]CAG2184015.1 unnamed protein product [Oppiella nova]